MSNKYKAYLRSPEWAEIRNDLYALRGKNCERCGSSYNIHIHHLTYDRLYNEEPKDLEILCTGCHSKEHGIKPKKKAKKFKQKSAYKYNEDTAKMFEDGVSSNGAFSRQQLAMLGITWNTLRKGWKKRLMKNSYPSEIRFQFVKLKDKHLPIHP